MVVFQKKLPTNFLVNSFWQFDVEELPIAMRSWAGHTMTRVLIVLPEGRFSLYPPSQALTAADSGRCTNIGEGKDESVACGG